MSFKKIKSHSLFNELFIALILKILPKCLVLGFLDVSLSI